MAKALSPHLDRAGSRGSVEAAYRQHSPHMWRALLAFSGSPEIASDAVAETFAQALRRGDEIRDPGRWVWKTAFRVASGMLKDRSRFVPAVEPAVGNPGPDFELQGALLRLSPRQRASTFLYYYCGYSPGEIAHLIGSTQSAVRVHLFRSRKRLAEILGGEMT